MRNQPEWFTNIVISACLLDESPKLNEQTRLLKDNPTVILGKTELLDELLKQKKMNEYVIIH